MKAALASKRCVLSFGCKELKIFIKDFSSKKSAYFYDKDIFLFPLSLYGVIFTRKLIFL